MGDDSRSRFDRARRLFSGSREKQSSSSSSESSEDEQIISTLRLSSDLKPDASSAPPLLPPPPLPKRPGNLKESPAQIESPNHNHPAGIKATKVLPSLNSFKQAPLLLQFRVAGDSTDNKSEKRDKNHFLSVLSTYVLVACGNIIYIFDSTTGEMLKALKTESSVSALHAAQNGIVWVGTDDGSIILFDSSSNFILVQQRHYAHSSNSIVQIIQCDGDMMTRDHTGIIIVWPKSQLTLTNRLFTLPRGTKRINWAANRLFAAVGKVCQVFSLADEAVLESEYDPAKAGIINIGALVEVSLLNDYLIAFHEDGKILVWSLEGRELILATSLGLSYRITKVCSTEGKLWIGLSTGRMMVIDCMYADPNAWEIYSDWKIHQSSISDLVCFRDNQVVTVSEDDSVCIWDTTLHKARNFKAMRKKQEGFSKFTEEDILVCSWNVGASKPPSTADLSFWSTWLGVPIAPVIIAVGLQEVISLDSKRSNAKIFLGADDGARYGLWTDRLKEALRCVYPTISYRLVLCQSLVGLLLVIFIREDELGSLSGMACESVKTGLGGYHGNKGSLLGRLILRDSSFCFINSHLAAGHHKVAARNSDAGMIIKTATFIPANVPFDQAFTNGGTGSAVDDFEHCFFFGDLNYRIDGSRRSVLEMIGHLRLDELAVHDQIRKQIESNSSFPLHSFTEGPLSFPPTYKFDPGTNNYDSSDKQRVPAWCDRIFYRPNTGLQQNGLGGIQMYDSVQNVTVSDHRPVHALVRVSVRQIDKEAYVRAKNGLINQ